MGHATRGLSDARKDPRSASRSGQDVHALGARVSLLERSRPCPHDAPAAGAEQMPLPAAGPREPSAPSGPALVPAVSGSAPATSAPGARARPPGPRAAMPKDTAIARCSRGMSRPAPFQTPPPGLALSSAARAGYSLLPVYPLGARAAASASRAAGMSARPALGPAGSREGGSGVRLLRPGQGREWHGARVHDGNGRPSEA